MLYWTLTIYLNSSLQAQLFHFFFFFLSVKNQETFETAELLCFPKSSQQLFL